MKFLDLFAGIGGFRLGMEAAGHQCVGYVEWDKYARQSYQAIHDTRGEWTAHDITTVTDNDIRLLGEQHRIDVITGGFPCQAFSVAGKQRGFADTRGTLFFEIARFASILKPAYLLLENVKGLLSHDEGNTFATILSALDELGYDAEWQVCNSKDFGVPQNRERVFIVGHLRGASGREVFPVTGENGEIAAELKELTKGLADADRIYDGHGLARTLKAEAGGGGAKTGWYTMPVVNQNGVLVEQKEGVTNCLDANYWKGMDKHGQRTHVVQALTEQRTEEAKRIRREHRMQGRDFSPRRGKKLVPRKDGIANCVTATQTVEHLLLEQTVQGCATRTRSYAGQPERLEIRDDNLSNTLTQAQKDSMVFQQPPPRIRKLTPRECWRLQGFPDWAFDRAQAAGVSDSQLYKQAGNSVSVPVIYAIARRFVDV